MYLPVQEVKGKKGGEKVQDCTQVVQVVQVVGDARLCKIWRR